MQLHPLFVTSLMDEHDRAMRERAQRSRAKPRKSKAPRRAPWIP